MATAESFKGSEGMLNIFVCEPEVSGRRANVLILCPDFPGVAAAGPASARSYPELSQRLAAESGWTVGSLEFRGTGRSEGNFSLLGWLDDVHCAVRHMRQRQVGAHIWLGGFGEGGAVALCVAAQDDGVRGVVGLGAPADFSHLSSDPKALLAAAIDREMVRDPDFPADLGAWGAEFSSLQPLELVRNIPPRPLMLIHGSDDEVAPPLDARSFVDAVEGQAELRLLTGADHQLRHDPRAIALLLGWMEPQTI